MRFLAAIVAVVVLCLAGLADDKTAKKWQEFRCEDGRYRIRFPGRPKALERTENTSIGDVTYTYQMVGEGAFGYSVVCVKYPKNVEKDAGQNLKRARDGAVKGLDGELVADKEITLDGHPGLEFVIRMKSGAWYRSRIFTVGTRLFQIIHVGTKQDARSRETDEFFDSFKLIN